MTTITGDGAVPHLVERVGDVELSLFDVRFLLAVFVKVVVAFDLLLSVVVVVVPDELVLLNLVVVGDPFINVLLVVDVLLDVIVPFFSAEVVVKDIVVEQFCQRAFVEQLVGGNVVLDAVLPIVCLMLSTMLVLNSANSILLMSGPVVRNVVAEVLSISCCRTSCRDLHR